MQNQGEKGGFWTSQEKRRKPPHSKTRRNSFALNRAIASLDRGALKSGDYTYRQPVYFSIFTSVGSMASAQSW